MANAAKSRPSGGHSKPRGEGRLTLEDVAWLEEHSFLPRRVISTLSRVVSEREEERSGAKPQTAIA